jgi:transcriptional regulator with XRE-family HTH domain
VPRVRSTELIVRDSEIARRAGEGESRRALAEEYGVSQARISQIVLAEQEEISDDANRAMMVANLFFVAENILAIQRRPRPPKVTPSGRIVYEPLLDENGEPVLDHKGQPLPDPAKPIYDDSPIIESAKMIPNLYDRISKLMGLEKKPKDREDTGALESTMQYINSLISQNKIKERELDDLRAQLMKASSYEIEMVPAEEESSPES